MKSSPSPLAPSPNAVGASSLMKKTSLAAPPYVSKASGNIFFQNELDGLPTASTSCSLHKYLD